MTGSWRERRMLRWLGNSQSRKALTPYEPPSVQNLAADMRRLDRQRREPPTTDSAAWSAAVLRAYDQRLSLACRSLDIDEHLANLDGMDRELERVRVEAKLQDAGFNFRADPADASAPLIVQEPATPPPVEEPAVTVEEPAATTASSEEPAARPAAAPAAAAAQLIGTVVHILPAGQRERYAEEFAGELFDLAAQGKSRWRQLLFVMRLLDRAWVLRAELAPPKQAPN
jgi:hypothetical protein